MPADHPAGYGPSRFNRAMVLVHISIVILASVLLLAGPPSAFAHAVIERSEPPANASLAVPPSRLVAVFNEPVNPAFSSVVVFDAEGRQVGEPGVFSKDGRQVIVSVGTLPRGVYTVKWRVLSTVDGHTTRGFFGFGVGEAVPGEGATEATLSPGPLRLAVRWVGFLAAILVAGIASFRAAVLRPTLSSLAQPDSPFEQVIARRLRTLAAIAALVVLLSVAVEFALQAMALLDATLREVVASRRFWPLLGSTKAGWGALVRMGAAVVVLLTAALPGRIARTGSGWVFLLAGAGLLAGIVVSSHASGNGLLAASIDWAHLLAVAVWIGGLPCLLLALHAAPRSDRQQVARVLVPQFSTLAGMAIALVILTGVYGAWRNLPDLRALTGTPYGKILLFKLGLVVPLVLLGALNRFVLRPRIAMAAGSSRLPVLRWFLRSVTGEVGVGAIVLLAVALLTITPPAKLTKPVLPPKPLVLAGLAEDVRVHLTITPALPGWNRFEAVVSDQDGRPIAAEARLLLRLKNLDEDLNPNTIPLIPQKEGRYLVESPDLAVRGWWTVEVVVRRRARTDASTVFPIRLGPSPAPPHDPGAALLLEQVRQALNQVGTWRQVEQITDGSGNVVVTAYEIKRPDRLRYRTSSGNEGVIVGADRYLRAGRGPWEKDTLSSPLTVSGPAFEIAGAPGARLGRTEPCDTETCRVLTWEVPGPRAVFAAWVGLTSRRVHMLLMIAPSHYMTAQFRDFGVPLEIGPPSQAP